MSGDRRKIGGFLLAGGTAFLAGAAALKGSMAAGLPALAAQAPAFAVAVTVSWLINRNLAFRASREGGSGGLLTEYGAYVASSGLGLILNVAGYSSALLLGAPPLAALVVGTATGLIANFLMYDRVVFRRH